LQRTRTVLYEGCRPRETRLERPGWFGAAMKSIPTRRRKRPQAVNSHSPNRNRMPAMSDVEPTVTPKTKAKAGPMDLPKFEIPRFDLPKFEMPNLEVPAAFREFAEKSVSQAKDNWEKMKAATEEATDLLEDSYATATRGAADYGLKMIEAARANTNA